MRLTEIHCGNWLAFLRKNRNWQLPGSITITLLYYTDGVVGKASTQLFVISSMLCSVKAGSGRRGMGGNQAAVQGVTFDFPLSMSEDAASHGIDLLQRFSLMLS